MMDKEQIYVALTDNNGYHWTLFTARPDQASAEKTGFIAVTEGFENLEDARALRDKLNLMFGIDPVRGWNP
jgi:hypothetical protein